MKNKGFTLLELMIAIAILTILISMLGPMFSSITKANKKSSEITRLDLTLGKSIDVFKRTIRSSKESKNSFGNVVGTSTTSGIFLAQGNSISTAFGNPVVGTSSSALVINVPKLNTSNNIIDERVILYFEGDKLKINSISDPGSNINFNGISNPTTLVTGVQRGQFEYRENIAIIELEVKVGETQKIIREAAVTRINIQF